MFKKFITISVAAFFVVNNLFLNYYVFADTKDSLLVYFDFDEVSDNVVKDKSGKNNNGVFIGNATTEKGDRNSSVLKLDGNGAVKLPENLFKENSNNITVTAWVKFLKDNRSQSQSQEVFNFGLDLGNYFSLSKDKSISLNRDSNEYGILHDKQYEEDKWIHIAITLNAGTLVYYENGIEIAKDTEVEDAVKEIGKFTENYIGKSQYATDLPFNGQVDEFRIYNDILTEEEIKDVMFTNLDKSQVLNVAKESLIIEGLNSVRSNLFLPKNINKNIKVTWESDNAEVIDINGKVNRPQSGDNVKVTLKAIINNGEESIIKEFKAFVVPISKVNYTLNVLKEEKNINDGSEESNLRKNYIEKIWSNNIITKNLNYELVNNNPNKHKDITGGISLGAAETMVQYDDFTIKNNKNDDIIFQDDFSIAKEDWKIIKGNWNVENGVLILNKKFQDYRVSLDNSTWSNYTVEVKAKKNSGDNGFLVGLGCKDNSNYYCFNVGDKSENITIDQVINGEKTTVNFSKEKVNIINGQEYKLKIIVSGKNIKCYIDDKLTNEYTEEISEGILASVGYGDKSSDLLVQLVNNEDENQEVMLNLQSLGYKNSEANIEYITFSNINNREEVDNGAKKKVKKDVVKNFEECLYYQVEKYSVNLFIIKKKDDNAVDKDLSKNNNIMLTSAYENKLNNLSDNNNKNLENSNKDDENWIYWQNALFVLIIILSLAISIISKRYQYKRKELS